MSGIAAVPFRQYYFTKDGTNVPLVGGRIDFWTDNTKAIRAVVYNDDQLKVVSQNPRKLDQDGGTGIFWLSPNQRVYYEVYPDVGDVIVNGYYTATQEGGDTPTESAPSINLCPSFDFPVDNYNGEISESNPYTGTKIVPSPGYSIECMPNDSAKVSFTLVPLNNSGLEGSPKNKLTLKLEEGETASKTRYFRFVIGNYASFQGKKLSFSAMMQAVSGIASPLNVALIRTKNGSDEIAINIGALAVTSTLQRLQIDFTVPTLSTTNYSESDTLSIAIILPNSSNELTMTGFWAQASSDGKIDIHGDSDSVANAKLLAGVGEIPAKTKDIASLMASCVGFSPDGLKVFSMTGEYSLYPRVNKKIPYGYIDIEANPEIIATKLYSDKRGKFIITSLRDNALTKSDLTFKVTPSEKKLTIETEIGAHEKDKVAWTVDAGIRLTIAKTVEEFAYKLSSTHQGNDITLTFVDNFKPGSTPINPIYPIADTPLYDVLPKSSPIVSWVGTHTSNTSAPGYITDRFLFSEALSVSVLSNGSPTTKASVKFSCPPVSKSQNLDVFTFGSNQDNFYYLYYDNYRATQITATSNGYKTTHFYNNIVYNSVSSNPAVQAAKPPFVHNFTVDGAVGSFQTGKEGTATIALKTAMLGQDVARVWSNTINTSYKYEITFTAPPITGDKILYSSNLTKYALIVVVDGASRPIPVVGVENNYVEILSSDTVSEAIKKIGSAIQNFSAGIPLPDDLGMPYTESHKWLYKI